MAESYILPVGNLETFPRSSYKAHPLYTSPSMLYVDAGFVHIEREEHDSVGGINFTLQERDDDILSRLSASSKSKGASDVHSDKIK